MKKQELKSPKYSTFALLGDIYSLLIPYRLRFTVASLIRLSSDIAWLYPPFALASIVTFLSNYTYGESLITIWWIIGIWIVLSIYHYIAHEINKYLGYQVAERISLDAQLKTIEHQFLLDLSWHEKENSGNKIKRMIKGGEGLEKILRIWFTNIIEISVNFIGMIFIIATFDPSMSFVIIAFLLTYFLFSYFLTRKAANAEHIVNVAEEEMHGLSFETINNIRSVKVLGMAKALSKTFKYQFYDLFIKIKNRIMWYRTREVILFLWSQAFRIGFVIYIIWGILSGFYELGFLVLFYGYFNKIWESIFSPLLTSKEISFKTLLLPYEKLKFLTYILFQLVGNLLFPSFKSILIGSFNISIMRDIPYFATIKS